MTPFTFACPDCHLTIRVDVDGWTTKTPEQGLHAVKRANRIRVYVSETASGSFTAFRLALGVYRAARELLAWRRDWLRRAAKCRADIPMPHDGGTLS